MSGVRIYLPIIPRKVLSLLSEALSGIKSLKSFGSEINLLSTQVKFLTDVTGQTETGVASMTSSMLRVTSEMDKTSQEFSRFQTIKKDFDEAQESLLGVSEDALSLQEVIKDTLKIEDKIEPAKV